MEKCVKTAGNGKANEPLPDLTIVSPQVAGRHFVSAINPTGMFGRPEVFTPERAAMLLETMPPNRPLRVSRVAAYSRSHEAGEWKLTHQGIAIDVNGHLRDGAHRLSMIVKTGKPAVLWVMYNVPDDSVRHMDEQLPRSIRDALRFADDGDFSNSAIALAQIIEGLPHTIAGKKSRDEIVETLKRCSDQIDFAETYCKDKRLTRGVRVLVARAYPHVDEERLKQWCTSLKNGKAISAKASEDDAAITYRNFLLRTTKQNGWPFELEKYRKGQSALAAFLNRSPMCRVYGTEEDLYPMIDQRA